MKTIGVIAEFNPFHNGHAWFLSEIRRRSDAGFVLVLMSGNFVQRGEPAIIDKYVRAETALRCGADLVLELPAVCAASGARRFAEGAAVILNGLGCVDELWFGSESGDIRLFEAAASLLANEPAAFSGSLRHHLSAGLTFPAARAAALADMLSQQNFADRKDISDFFPGSRELSLFLDQPNNILGLEYMLALSRSCSRIRPRTLMRSGNAYHDKSLDASLTSAAALRGALLSCPRHISEDCASGLTDPDAALAALKSRIPEAAEGPLAESLSRSVLMTADSFSSMLHYQLLRESRESLTNCLDMPGGLAYRITHLLPEFRSWTQFAALLKTRNITRSQVDRALLHVLLSLTPDKLEQAMHPAGVRLLGFRKEALPLLSLIKKNGSLHLAAGATDPTDHTGDLFASNLYEARCAALSGRPFVHEYRREILRI